MLISFIEKLICNTKKDSLTWIDDFQLENRPYGSMLSNEVHLSKKRYERTRLGQEGNTTEVWSYRSLFLSGERVEIDNTPYHTTINIIISLHEEIKLIIYKKCEIVFSFISFSFCILKA